MARGFSLVLYALDKPIKIHQYAFIRLLIPFADYCLT